MQVLRNNMDEIKVRMIFMSEYTETVKKQNILALRALLKEMPPFCTDYFRGIASSTLPRTQTGYCRDIYTFLQFIIMSNPLYKDYQIKDLPLKVLEEMTPADMDEYLEHLNYYVFEGTEYRNGESAKARKLSALSNMYSFFNKRQAVSNNPLTAVDRPKVHDKVIITLDQEQIFDLMDAVESPINMTDRQKKFHNLTMARDRAILTSFLGTGMRVSELAGLDITDVDFNNQTFRVIRKGGNEAYIYFGDDIRDALCYYLGIQENQDEPNDGIKPLSPRESLLKGNDEEKALFLSLRGNRMAVRSIEVMVKKYCTMINTNKKITPHKLRSTYGTALYKETGDIYLVADVLGHKDVNTTKKHYAEMSNDNRKRAANIVTLKKIHEKNT
ncbi:tyrosine-type recombinase/integrase [Schaedlerella arabinosiphila]|uniref:tyrosine-type recombinase/integrase n=1 Tax=Schaedlerella arabinosiphila TaxID=2044587 RepID=UPI0025582165|nr:tyrosine-type recombinase/integrase [Schaedlerella arabinosiphila]